MIQQAKIARAERRRERRADGIFIAVEVDDSAAADAELARKLTEACPVDIFAQERRRRRWRSSSRTSTSACSAACAWTPRPTGAVQGDQALRRRRRPRLSARARVPHAWRRVH